VKGKRPLTQDEEMVDAFYGAPHDDIPVGSLVVFSKEGAPPYLRGLEGVLTEYDISTAVVQLANGEQVLANTDYLAVVPVELPEVGDRVAINQLQPHDAGEVGVVEVVGMMTGEVQIRTPDGRLLCTWPCCLASRAGDLG